MFAAPRGDSQMEPKSSIVHSWTQSFVITIPAATPPGNEVSDTKQVPIDGHIQQIVLHVPAGVQGLAGVFFTIEGHQVFPPKEGDSIQLDDATIPYDVDIEVMTGDRIQFKGFNNDVTNPHTIRAQITVFPEA